MSTQSHWTLFWDLFSVPLLQLPIYLDSALHCSSLETTVILLFSGPLLRLETCLDSALHGSSLETIVVLP